MKYFYLIFFLFIVLGCTKDENCPNETGDNGFYATKGNVLVLMISDSLEAAYEYNIPNASQYTDSLPIFITSDHSVMEGIRYLHFGDTTDTLVQIPHSQSYNFYSAKIENSQLERVEKNLSFNPSHLDFRSPHTEEELEFYWNKISNLNLLHIYNHYALSKPHCRRTIEFVFNEDLGFSIPKEKLMLIFSKY